MVVFNARGLMPAVFTPLNDDHTVNCSVIPSYADYLANCGIKAVLVGGTTGEHMTLSVKERKEVIDAWVKVSKQTGLHIQCQVGGTALNDVIDLAKYCSENGVHSIMTLPELYFRAQTVNELVSYVERVARAAPDLPVLYYHNPRMSNVTLSMPQFSVAASKRIPNYKGMKFTSSDLVEAAQVLKTLKDDQEIFLGGERLLAPAATLGIKSCIGSPTNFFPDLAQRVLAAMDKGDFIEAQKLQNKLTFAINTIAEEGDRISVNKTAMEIVSGIKMGLACPLKEPLSSDVRQRIAEKLRNLDYVPVN